MQRRERLTHVLTLAAATAALSVQWWCSVEPVHAQVDTRVIAFVGDDVPGGNGVFSQFSQPVINNAGHVAFLADLTGTSGGAADAGGAYRGSVTGIAQLARVGQTVINGQPAKLAGIFRLPRLNDADVTVMNMSLTNISPARDGIFRGSGGVLTEIAREGAPAPFNGTFSNLDAQAQFNVFGASAFRAQLSGTSGGANDDLAVYRGDGFSPLTQIARKGQPAPDGDGGLSGYFRDFTLTPELNIHGQVAFSSALSASVGGPSIGSGIFTSGSNNDELMQIARNGLPAPDGNGTFQNVGHPRLNDVFQVAFHGELTGAMGGATSGVFRGGGGPIAQIFRRGQLAPDGNGTILSFTTQFALNNSNQVAFHATLDVPGAGLDSVILRGNGGPLTLIVREGQLSPDGNGKFDTLNNPHMNDSGQIAFLANLASIGGGTTNGAGIFLYDDTSGLIKIARSGDPFLGSTIAGVGFLSNSLSGKQINNRGQVAYTFSLADGRRGIAVSTPSRALAFAIDAQITVQYRTPQATGPLVVGFDPLPATVTATFRLNNLLPGQTTVGLDQVLTFDLDFAGETITRDDLDDFQLTLDANGTPTDLNWGVNRNGMEPKIIITNNSFTLTISGVDPETEEAFSYFWSEATNELVAAPPPLGCDFNGDGQVNGADLALWKMAFGDAGAFNFGDADFDGDVDGDDFLCWQRELGAGFVAPATGAVPEPSAAALAHVLLGACLFSRVGLFTGVAGSAHASERLVCSSYPSPSRREDS